MGEYDGIRPQDDFGHSMDDEDDLSKYHPGGGAMVAMGYEPGASDFEAFDMSHTWAPGMPTGYPHGPFDEPQMGWENEIYQRQGPESRLFGRGVGWKDQFGDDADPAVDLTADLAVDQDTLAVPYGYRYGFPHRPGWAAWQRPLGGMFRRFRR